MNLAAAEKTHPLNARNRPKAVAREESLICPPRGATVTCKRAFARWFQCKCACIYGLGPSSMRRCIAAAAAAAAAEVKQYDGGCCSDAPLRC
eukprot:3313-Heterococcus_DN1.PRE.2